MLAAAGRDGLSRDRLAACLWPEASAESAGHSLADAVYRLRKELGKDAIEGHSTTLRLNFRVIRADVVDFENAVEAGDLATAADLYGGGFLDGFHLRDSIEFEHWKDAEAQRLDREIKTALETLADRAETGGDHARAADWLRRLLALDPFNSRTAMRLMKVLAAGGDPANAVKLAAEHGALLVEDLGVEPPAELQALAERLRVADNGPMRAAQAARPVPRPMEPPGSVSESAAEQGAASTTSVQSQFPWKWIALLAIAAVVLIAGAISLRRWASPGVTVPSHPRTAIGVLPFQNLSAEGPYDWFAGSLHDELLTQLAKVTALAVPGRTSVMAYEGTTRPPREIADELSVGSIVEATVLVLGDSLRVNVKLLEAGTGVQLWADIYDATLDDAFAIQSDIARQVAAAVGVALTGTETSAIAAMPTADGEAYLLYLQGEDYRRRPGGRHETFEIAQQLYQRALELDSTFALAYASLSFVHGSQYWEARDPDPSRLERQRSAAEAAVRLAPDLPQARWAMGMTHYYELDFERALEEFTAAAEALPGSAELWSYVGYAHRRLGNYEKVLDMFEKVVELDPGNPNMFFDLGGNTYRFLHRYPEAVEAYNRTLELAPDYWAAQLFKARTYYHWLGDLDTLRSVLRRAPDILRARDMWRARLALWERQPDALLTSLDAPETVTFEFQDWHEPGLLYAAWAHQLRGDTVAATRAFAGALAQLDTALAEIPEDLQDWRVHAARGLALAGLRQRQKALREARWLGQSPVHDDAYAAPRLIEGRARIFAQVGETDAALDEIERLLDEPSWFSVHTLRYDPIWDPIREDPRFLALIEKYTHDVEH